MATVRAILKDNAVTFLESVDLPAGTDQPILVTFLDKNLKEFGDLSQKDLLKTVDNLPFSLSDREIEVLGWLDRE